MDKNKRLETVHKDMRKVCNFVNRTAREIIGRPREYTEICRLSDRIVELVDTVAKRELDLRRENEEKD
jgi:hypothetical protein